MSLQSQPKAPPYSAEAEQCVLGGMMLENFRIPDVAERLVSDDFYRDDHRIIFSAIVALSASGKPADAITVYDRLRANGEDREAGGLAYIGQLANDVPSAANIHAYVDEVYETSTLRKMIFASSGMIDSCYSRKGQTAGQILDVAEQQIFGIRQRGKRANTGPASIGSFVDSVEQGIEARRSMNGNGVTGLPTGIHDLDQMTTGLHAGDLVIVAGRPSMGKTSLALNIAELCGIDHGKTALIFSMEMPASQLTLRTMSSQGKIHMQSLRSGRMTDEEMDRLSSIGGPLRDARIRIDETGGLSPQELRARARREAMRGTLGVIVVDYIQLMQVPGTKESRTGEVSEISRNLKALAKELCVPIIALSQLNRGVESREDKRPRMSDLRESGGIEQDADLIIFVYRDEVYNKQSPHAGTAELIIGKQRNGPLGMVRTAFLGEYCKFQNLAHGWQPQLPEVEDKPKTRGFGRMTKPQAVHHWQDDAA